MENSAIFVTTYKKYSNNSLGGEWVDLTDFTDYNDFVDYCRELHEDEQDAEFMVTCIANMPRCLYHENGLPTKEEFNKIKEISLLSDEQKTAFDFYVETYHYIPLDVDLQEYQNRFLGKFDTLEEFVENWLTINGYFDTEIPQLILHNIDYNGIWNGTLKYDISENCNYYFYDR